MRQFHSFLAATLAGVLMLATLGCSNPDSKYAKVEGTVTYKQQPVAEATVTFVSTDSSGESAAGRTDSSGQFTLTSSQAVKGGAGIVPGEYRVVVSKRSASPPDPDEEAHRQGKIDYDELQKRKSAKDSSLSTDRTKELLPAKYGRASSTDLTATVEKGKKNTFTFDLLD